MPEIQDKYKAAQDQPLPEQRPLGEEEAPKAPSKLKKFLTRALTVLLILLALALFYVFLLLGEPDKDVAETSGKNSEAPLQVPIQAVQLMGGGDLNGLAQSFGKPILTLSSGANVVSATLYDTAFEGGYARCVTVTCQMESGAQFTLRSIRPDAAVTLLSGERFTQKLGAQYTLAGMDAQYLQSEQGALLLARGEGACYALYCPLGLQANIESIAQSCLLMQSAQ